jgi:hypothetical protein
MTDERRSDKRVSLNLSTKWRGVTGQHEGRIEDLSVHGCFVNTVGAVDVGEIVSLLIKLPSDQWLSLRGKVMSSQQMVGFGLSFSILDEKEQQALAELVRDHA